jgi:AcrR family transcriptional regulator
MDQVVRRQAADGPAAGPVPSGYARVVGCAVAAADALARPARRRGAALEQAIFEAVLDQLTSGGYARLTMEGVAGAARTGKAALYRRWASKVDLVLDALRSTLPPPTDIPDLGSARSELLLLIDHFGVALESRAGGAVNAVMNELDHDQAQIFKEFLVERVIEPTKAATLSILRRGEDRGDVRPGAANPLVADVAPAMLMYRVKVRGGRLGHGYGTELVDEVLLPMIRR